MSQRMKGRLQSGSEDSRHILLKLHMGMVGILMSNMYAEDSVEKCLTCYARSKYDIKEI